MGAGLVGLATAFRDGVAIDARVAVAALALACVAHAAARELRTHRREVARLVPAIRLTIAAALLHAVALAAGIAFLG